MSECTECGTVNDLINSMCFNCTADKLENDGFVTLHPDLSPELVEELSAFNEQVGGDHYKKYPDGYQPLQVAHEMNMNPYQFSMLKYMLRDKTDTVEDIEKLIHVAQMYKEVIKHEQ